MRKDVTRGTTTTFLMGGSVGGLGAKEAGSARRNPAGLPRNNPEMLGVESGGLKFGIECARLNCVRS